MLENVENNILINEIQLGEKLNQCIHSERRSDFSLMLAMLVDDVREHSQFSLPIAETTEQCDIDKRLRNEFHLPPQASLSVKDPNNLSDFNQSGQLGDSRLVSIHLSNALSPLPLACFDDVKRLPSSVINNTSLYCQTRHKSAKPTLSERAKFNAKAWLDGIETSIVKAPVLSV